MNSAFQIIQHVEFDRIEGTLTTLQLIYHLAIVCTRAGYTVSHLKGHMPRKLCVVDSCSPVLLACPLGGQACLASAPQSVGLSLDCLSFPSIKYNI